MLEAGSMLKNRYKIIDKIGSGGMAYVYKAQDTALNRFVAVKILKAEYSQDETFVKKFRVEAQSAAGLSNPNVVGVYDVGEED
ncbi:MAG: protein kinase domain-containing protein, partial [bacterium]